MSNTEHENQKSLPIGIKNLSKSYGDVYALEDVSLDIKAGEFITLLGPSGSGKTTLLMTIAGFVSPDQGSIYFGQQEMTMTPPHMRGLGMVFQNYAIFPHMDVRGNIAFGMRKSGLSKTELNRRIDETLELIKLQGYGKRSADELSGGQRQRVALARALIKQPKVLLLDEPSLGLAPMVVTEIFRTLRALRDDETTIFLVEQNARRALQVADRGYVLERGQITLEGTGQHLLDDEKIQQTYLGKRA